MIKLARNISVNLLVICVFLLLPSIAEGATLYLMPQSQTIYQGDSFISEIRLDTEGEEINTTQVGLTLPQNLLEAIDFSKGGSILALWVEEPKIQQGEINFIGGVPEGFKGDGLLGKISFLGKEIGKAEVSFKEDSKVLYGEGIPASLTFLNGNYEIIKKPEEIPVITSESHPDQNKWYKDTRLQLYWVPKEEAEYSWILSRSPLDTPDEIPDKPLPKEGVAFWMGAMEYDLKGEGDGIYYFSLRQKLLGEDWQKEVSRFRAMIDATPPEEFEPQIGQDPAVFEGKYFLSFATTDKTSGADHYEIKEGKGEWRIGNSPYLLEDQSLRNKILVKAVDKAGNERIVEIIPPCKITWKDIISWTILALIIGVVVWFLLKKLKRAIRTKG